MTQWEHQKEYTGITTLFILVTTLIKFGLQTQPDTDPRLLLFLRKEGDGIEAIERIVKQKEDLNSLHLPK